MRDKPTRKDIQLLHDLANDGGYVALKCAAEDRERWRYREEMSDNDDVDYSDDDDDNHSLAVVGKCWFCLTQLHN